MTSNLGAEVAQAPLRIACATLLLLPVELVGLALGGEWPRLDDWRPLVTALLAGACAIEALLLLASVFGAHPRTTTARAPAMALWTFGLLDALGDRPALLEWILAVACTTAAVLTARALLPAKVWVRPRLAAWIAVPLALLAAPRDRDGFFAQRLAQHAPGPYAEMHEALHDLVLWRRGRIVRALGKAPSREPTSTPADAASHVVRRTQAEPDVTDATIATTLALDTSTGPHPFTIPDDALALRSLSLANTGSTPIRVHRFAVDGVGPHADADDLVDALGLRDLPPLEAAERLWAHLAARWQHAAPPHEGETLHDPIDLLQVWGYGFCDDIAQAFVHLARRAGLQSRLWALEGHVVPEVRDADGFHMFDPDCGVYYRDADGKVASVVHLSEHPDALSRPVVAPGLEAPRYAPEILAPIFASLQDNHLQDVWPQPAHDFALDLRPDEQVRFATGPAGLRFGPAAANAATRVGNGTWTYAVARTPGVSEVVLPFALPYPILDGRITTDGPAEISLRRPRGEWTTLPDIGSGGDPRREVALSDFVRLDGEHPDRALDVRVAWTSDAAREVRVVLDFQYAPASLPVPGAGPHVLTLDATPDDGRALITFEHARD